MSSRSNGSRATRSAVIANGLSPAADGVDYLFEMANRNKRGIALDVTVPDAERLVMQRPALGDVPSGMFLAGGVCAALVHVLRTGKGCVVDTSLLNAAMWSLGPDMAYSSITGDQMPRMSLASGVTSPLVGVHRTEDSRWLMLSMLDEPRYWAPTCRALGFPELVDQFADDGERRAHWPELTPRFSPRRSHAGPVPSWTRACARRAASSRSSRRRPRCSPIRRWSTTATRSPTPCTRGCGWWPRPCSSTTSFRRRVVPPHDTASAHRMCSTELGYTHDEIDGLLGDGVVR